MIGKATGLVPALALSLAALLAAASASAAKIKKATGPRIEPEAGRLMAQGLGNLERGESSAAISNFNKAVRRQGTVSSYFLLGWAHYQRGFKSGTTETADRDDAQSAIDAYSMALSLDATLRELPDRSRLYFSLALCYEAVQSYDRALDAYKTAFRAAPGKALIPLHAARLRLKMKDGAKAVQNVQLAMQKAMSNGQGRALRDAARRDPAFAALLEDGAVRKALNLGMDPEDDGDLIVSLDARGEDLRDSVRDTAPRRASPAQDPAVLDRLAQGNLEFKSRRYLAALAAYNDALSLNQERLTLSAAQISQVYEKIGTAYNKLGQAETAVGALIKSLEQSPVNPSARYQLALAYGLAGKTAVALNALRESLKSCGTPAELRRLMMQAKTDIELEAMRDLPGFRATVAEYADKIALR